jgi:multiple antibiotic resistance protein
MFQRILELLIIIDPLGAVPLFLAIVAGRDAILKRKIACLASAALFFGGTFFMLSGAPLLQTFGITSTSFNIVGGIVLFLVGFNLMQLTPSKLKTEPAGEFELPWLLPIAFPMLLGPASIGALMATEHSLQGIMVSMVALGVVAVINAVTLLGSIRLYSRLEPATTHLVMSILERLIGLLVCAMGIELLVKSLRLIFFGN